MTATARKSTSMTIDPALLGAARELGINISRAAEAGVAQAVQAARAARWQAENQAAISQYNDLIDRDGVPLAEYRKF